MTDILANIYATPQGTIDIGTPENAHTWQVFYSGIKSPMFCWSFSLTAILGTVRCVVIHYPFCHINKVLVLSIALGMLMFTVGLSLGKYMESDEHFWNTFCLQIFGKESIRRVFETPSTSFLLGYSKTALNMLTSLLSAVLSVWGIKKADRAKKSVGSGVKSSGNDAAVTIVYLNCLIAMHFVLFMSSLVLQRVCPEKRILINYISFLNIPFSNTIISAINPLIYILRSSKIKQKLFQLSPRKISGAGTSENTAL